MDEQTTIDRASRLAQAKDLDGILKVAMEAFEAAVGTIHRDTGQETLELVVQRGLPDVLLDTVQLIPYGKGMAGLAVQRRVPVQVCNLQTDDSGAAKAGAKLTQMEGSIALPILAGDDIKGAFGIGKPVPHEFDEAEVRLLEAIAQTLAAAV